MKLLRASLLLLFASLLGLPAAADQTDQRLPGLFDELLAAKNPQDARQLEGLIWQIWYEHDDNAIRLLMRDGRGAMSRRDFTSAERSFNQVVKIAPRYAEGWNARATLYYLMGRYEDSLGDILVTLDLEPRHFGALSGRGLIYAELEEWDKALEAFEAALAVNPHMAGARHNAEALRKSLQDKEI
ncbi:MAG: tetratricopeptide repeat protein [Pseudomonadota bacterium]